VPDPFEVPSEEESPHSPANSLSVVEDIELVHKLVHGVASFGDGAKVGHEPHIIALLGGNRKNQFPRGSSHVQGTTESHTLSAKTMA
jgi:hypothetical protein